MFCFTVWRRWLRCLAPVSGVVPSRRLWLCLTWSRLSRLCRLIAGLPRVSVIRGASASLRSVSSVGRGKRMSRARDGGGRSGSAGSSAHLGLRHRLPRLQRRDRRGRLLLLPRALVPSSLFMPVPVAPVTGVARGSMASMGMEGGPLPAPLPRVGVACHRAGLGGST